MKTSPPPELWRFSHRHPRAEARGDSDAAANVIEVQVGIETEPFGCTDNHPFWSVDREQFVEAGQLRIGENLQSADGTLVQVTRITPRRGLPVDVFNFEVDVDHVCHVGNSGVLVHNACHHYWPGWLGTSARFNGNRALSNRWQSIRVLVTLLPISVRNMAIGFRVSYSVPPTP